MILMLAYSYCYYLLLLFCVMQSSDILLHSRLMSGSDAVFVVDF